MHVEPAAKYEFSQCDDLGVGAAEVDGASVVSTRAELACVLSGASRIGLVDDVVPHARARGLARLRVRGALKMRRRLVVAVCDLSGAVLTPNRHTS